MKHGVLVLELVVACGSKVTVEPFAGITARGTLHGRASDDCTITPR